MKSNTPIVPIVVTAAIVIAIFAGVYVTSASLEAPQARFNNEIMQEVEKAQRMLVGYDPAASLLLIKGQTAESGEAQTPGSEPAGPEGRESGEIQALNRQLQTLRSELGQHQREAQALGASAAPRVRTYNTFAEYKAELAKNEKLLDQAMQIVRQAVGKNVSSGTESYSGSMHPAVTQLEAILYYYKGDLMGRQSDAYRTVANRQRQLFFQQAQAWQELDAKIRSRLRSIRENVQQPMVMAAERLDETTLEPQNQPQTEVAEDKTSGGKNTSGKLSKMLRNLLNKDSEPTGEEPMAAVDETQPMPADTRVDRQDKPVDLSPAEIIYEQFPTLSRRIADLQQRKEDIRDELQRMREQAEQLQEKIDNIAEQVKTYKAQATQAEQRMMALEDAVNDPEKPMPVDQFKNEYEQAAQDHRAAWSKAQLLEKGAILNAQPSTWDEAEIAHADLVPDNASEPMEPVIGLDTYQKDYDTVQALITRQEDRITAIDAAVETLQQAQSQLESTLTEWQSSREEILRQAGVHARKSAAAMIEAYRLNEEAVRLIENNGLSAAQRAVRAASKHASDVRNFITSENRTDTPNPKLTEMANDRFMSGHLSALEGDMYLLMANLQAAQAMADTQHATLLRLASLMDLSEPSRLLPEDMQRDNVADAMVNSQAAQLAADEALTAARTAAEKALSTYQEADRDLKQLWTLHTSIASAQYMLARLAKDEKVRREYLEKAAIEYKRAMQNRENRWEAPAYQAIVDKLVAELR